MKRFQKILIVGCLFITMTALAVSGFAASLKGKELVGKVNINTATAEELALLPRIGEKVAARIIDYRTAQGPFKSINDLTQVKGIGEKTFNRLSQYISVTGKTDLRIIDLPKK